MVTDYPFDRWRALSFGVTGGPDGEELPVAVTLLSTDPFFAVSAAGRRLRGGTSIAVNLRRSTPTLVYTSFVMVSDAGFGGRGGDRRRSKQRKVCSSRPVR